MAKKMICENCGNNYVLKNMEERDKNSGRFCSWNCMLDYGWKGWDVGQEKLRRTFASSRKIIN